MFFLLLFLSSWAFPAPIHEGGIVVQGDSIIYEELAEKREVIPLIYVSKGAVLVDNNAVLNATIINEGEVPKVKTTKTQIVNQENTKSYKKVNYVKKINVDFFYKNSNESFHTGKIEENEVFTLVNYSFSGKALVLFMFLLGLSTLFCTFILNQCSYNARFCDYLFKSFRIRPPPQVWARYS
ncbi:hypothetical protein [Chryseobacterium sp. CFBP8996]|uniref:hypothetical protein n=1 Tax=Chryseobacterium sp. CFBP8996 TaxID=3096529 RepID=UPI002A69DD82|nr:hypothetical protein [Chryseobacterium sp. CFBP8996]MDY0932341.1 hypothetical protein [Chryseobacterium sp. CFBP8996]